ncbi:MAG: hypothetical protein LBF16_03090 [Pseudomonadales bacterium]|jgi:Mn-dependent DtxR family transcriptional regulator|nr:hypothetical protein [Pseudomonadales bacterium]
MDTPEIIDVHTGIVLSSSKAELQKWLQALYSLATASGDIPFEQLARDLGVDERTVRRLAQSIHDFSLNSKDYKKPRRTRRHGVIEPIDAVFDTVAGKLATNPQAPAPLMGEGVEAMAGQEYARVKSFLRTAFRAMFAIELRRWEEALSAELWEAFKDLMQWRDNLPSRPPWWDKLVTELLCESLDVDVAKYLLAMKSGDAPLLEGGSPRRIGRKTGPRK